MGFIDVKNPAIGVAVKHAGKQVSYVQKYIIVAYSGNTLVNVIYFTLVKRRKTGDGSYKSLKLVSQTWKIKKRAQNKMDTA